MGYPSGVVTGYVGYLFLHLSTFDFFNQTSRLMAGICNTPSSYLYFLLLRALQKVKSEFKLKCLTEQQPFHF